MYRFSRKIIWLELTSTNNDPQVVASFYLDALLLRLANILFSTYHFAKWPSYPFHNGFFSTMTLPTIFHTLSHMHSHPSYESMSISSRSLHPSHVYTDCSLASPFLCPISILLYIPIIDSYYYTMSHHSIVPLPS